MTQRQLFVTASALGFLAVALGAFGAHALKEILLAHGKTDTFELAVRYQFLHTLTLLFLGIHHAERHKKTVWLLLTGIALFSGSLYFLALTNSTSLVLVTPVGGLFLLAAWANLVYTFVRS
jgi:uncharacterized membrane protein YgdD (TMEM256/DUF423 family)